jgi:hypothetical protein
MSEKNNITVLISMLILSVMVYATARWHVNAIRSDYSYRLQVAATPIPVELLKALACEFKGLMADYYLMEAASFVGGNTIPTEKQWNAVARLLEQSSVLDPYFRQTYILAQGVLPWGGKKYKETLALLERSKKHRYWDWEPGFYKGFDYFYFLKDNLTASKELMEASQKPDAPILIATLASRLASEVGQTQAAIVFLNTMLANTEDEDIRKTLEKRVLALKGVLILQRAIDRFQDKLGRLPATLNELVDEFILPAIPFNPYERSYSYRDGKVIY